MTALRLLADENLNRVIVAAMARLEPALEFSVATDVGLAGQADPVVLDYASRHGLIVVTHDVRTMIAFANERLARGEPMPGLFVAPQESSSERNRGESRIRLGRHERRGVVWPDRVPANLNTAR